MYDPSQFAQQFTGFNNNNNSGGNNNNNNVNNGASNLNGFNPAAAAMMMQQHHHHQHNAQFGNNNNNNTSQQHQHHHHHQFMLQNLNNNNNNNNNAAMMSMMPPPPPPPPSNNNTNNNNNNNNGNRRHNNNNNNRNNNNNHHNNNGNQFNNNHQNVTVNIQQKQERNNEIGEPARVIHMRNVTPEVSQLSIQNLVASFGRIRNIVMLRQKNQALVEMETLQSAQQMVDFFKDPGYAEIDGRRVYLRYSLHNELTASVHTSKALLVSMFNTQYDVSAAAQITPMIVYQIFGNYGQVEKIVVLPKNESSAQNHNRVQALVQFETKETAETVKNMLQGQPVTLGETITFTLDIQFSRMEEIKTSSPHNSLVIPKGATPSSLLQQQQQQAAQAAAAATQGQITTGVNNSQQQQQLAAGGSNNSNNSNNSDEGSNNNNNNNADQQQKW